MDSRRQLRHAASRRGIAISSACRTACTATRAATSPRWRRCPTAARNVGAVYAHDDWTISDSLTIGYGANYAHYDYLARACALQPARERDDQRRADTTRIRAMAARQVARARAPKNSCRRRDAQVLPPQRTFAPLTRDGFVPEDMQHYEVGGRADAATARRSACARSSSASTISWSPCSACARRTRRRRNSATTSSPARGDVDVRGWGVTLTHDVAGYRARIGRLLALRRREWTPSDRAARSRSAGAPRAVGASRRRREHPRPHDVARNRRSRRPPRASSSSSR